MFKTTYPNINISVSCCCSANSQSLKGFLKYLLKNTALLAQTFWRKRIVKIQNPFPAFLRQKTEEKKRKKKVLMATKPNGGVGLNSPATKKETFFAASFKVKQTINLRKQNVIAHNIFKVYQTTI